MTGSPRVRPHHGRSKITIKAALRPALDLLPDQGRALKHLRWHLYLAYWNRVLARRRGEGPAIADPNRIYWVPTNCIQSVTEHPRRFHVLVH